MAVDKTTGKSTQAGKESPGLRMRDLVAASGVPKSTILHYLNEGLLPSPVKTSRNMAYYDPSCVERLSLIRFMQNRHRLSLGAIKDLLQDMQNGRELTALVELNTAIFGRGPEDGELLDPEAFCQATGLTSKEVGELLSAGLMLPLEADRFDPEDVAMGRLWRHGLELGLTPADAAYYRRLAEKIVDAEMAVRHRLTSHLSREQNAVLTLELTRTARALRAYIIDRVFQHRVLTMKSLKHQEKEP